MKTVNAMSTKLIKQRTKDYRRQLKSNPLCTTIVIAIFIMGSLFCGNSEADGARRRTLPQAKINAFPGTDNQLIIIVRIPRHHHAYLNRGKEGVLIPITFIWKKMIDSGLLKKNPRVVLRPKGKYDKLVQARVLHGKSEFVFRKADGPWKKGGIFEVRTQICHEIKGQCYPPRTHKITIR